MSLNVGDLTTQLTLDQSQFNRGMQLSETALQRLAQVAQTSGDTTDQSLRQAGQQAGVTGSRVEAIQQYLQRASEEARNTGQQFNRMQMPASLQNDIRAVVDEMERAERAARDAQQEISQIGQGTDEIGQQAGGGLGDGMMAGLSGAIGGIAAKAGPIGTALVGVATLGLGAGAMLAKAISDGLQSEQDMANLQAQYKLDPATMATVGRAAGESYRQAFGESISDQADIIARAMQSGVLIDTATEQQMTDFANKLSTVNQLTGSETEQTMRAVNNMAKAMGVDATRAMDLISAAATKNKDATDDLIDSVREYSNGWANTGFSAEYTMGLISQSMEFGSDNTDRAADAIREFGRRLYEETDKISEAIGTINEEVEGAALPVDELMESFKKGGPEAEAAFDTVFDAIRQIEDPLVKNQVTMELLGDTAGDFIGAFTKWDPSKAVEGLGEIEGATQRASDVMGGTGQASLTTALRSIEVLSNDAKVALAEAFGPTLQGLAEWVSTHRGEIIQFFTDLGVGTLDALIAVGHFASSSLEMLSEWYGSVAPIMADAFRLFGGFSEKIGGIIKHIPGFEDVGGAMEDAGSAAQWWGDQVDKVPGALDAAKAGVDAMIPGLVDARNKLDNSGTAAADTAKLMTALGDTVVSLPDGKTITIQENTPEVRAELEKLGLKVETLPDGSFAISANTAEGQRIVDSFIARNSNREVPLIPKLVGRTFSGSVSVRENADGSVQEPGPASIRDRVVNQWAEAGGEAFIPFDPAKRTGSEAILAEVADRFGFRLEKWADGGINEGLTEYMARKFPSLKMTSGDRSTNDYHGSGQAADFSNGQGNTDEMLAAANYLADNHREDLLELIYIDPRFGRTIKNGEFVPDSFWGDEQATHRNHLHVAASKILTDPQAARAPRSERQQLVDSIVKVGKEMGMSDQDIAAAVATGLVESNLQNLDYGDRDSVGAFQQRNFDEWTKGGTRDRMNPEDAARSFFEHYQQTDPNKDPGERAADVQRPQEDLRYKYGDRMAEAEELVRESLAANATGGDTPSGTLAGSPSHSGTVQDVFVTNWPSQLGGEQPEDTGEDTGTAKSGNPVARLGLAFYAAGGYQPQMLGPGDGVRVWNEPEAGGESYIPHDPARRGRALDILSQTAIQFGYSLVPKARMYASGGMTAGFGGYSNHADDYQWGPHSGFDALAMGIGGLFAVGSAFAHLPGMAGSDTLTLGDLAGSGMDTSANTIPGFDQLLGKLDEIAKKLKGGVVIEHAEINDPKRMLEEMADRFRRDAGFDMPSIQTGGR